MQPPCPLYSKNTESLAHLQADPDLLLILKKQPRMNKVPVQKSSCVPLRNYRYFIILNSPCDPDPHSLSTDIRRQVEEKKNVDCL